MIGNMVKKRRLELGMTQEELAAKLGYDTKSAICLIENNKRDISTNTLEKICKLFNAQPNYFFNCPEFVGTDSSWKDMYEELLNRYEDLHDDYIELSVALATIKKQLNQIDLD